MKVPSEKFSKLVLGNGKIAHILSAAVIGRSYASDTIKIKSEDGRILTLQRAFSKK